MYEHQTHFNRKETNIKQNNKKGLIALSRGTMEIYVTLYRLIVSLVMKARTGQVVEKFALIMKSKRKENNNTNLDTDSNEKSIRTTIRDVDQIYRS